MFMGRFRKKKTRIRKVYRKYLPEPGQGYALGECEGFACKTGRSVGQNHGVDDVDDAVAGANVSSHNP
jgi:hypothetical protein